MGKRKGEMKEVIGAVTGDRGVEASGRVERRVADPSDPLTEITDDNLEHEERVVRELHGDIGTAPPPDKTAGGAR